MKNTYCEILKSEDSSYIESQIELRYNNPSLKVLNVNLSTEVTNGVILYIALVTYQKTNLREDL